MILIQQHISDPVIPLIFNRAGQYTIEAGTTMQVRDRLTKTKRLEKLDEEEFYLTTQIERSLLAPNQVKTIIQGFKDRCFPGFFPERNWQGEDQNRHME